MVQHQKAQASEYWARCDAGKYSLACRLVEVLSIAWFLVAIPPLPRPVRAQHETDGGKRQ